VHAIWSRLSTDAVGIVERFRRAQCGLVGHAMVLQFEPHRMSLRCMNCGAQTPGWALHDSRELRLLGLRPYTGHRTVN
jgi:hypothetical protein